MTFSWKVEQLPALSSGERPETGPMQFGEDWPGVFIRGDNALFDAMAIDGALMLLPADAWMVRAQLMGIRDTLRSCSVGNTGWPPTPEPDKPSELLPAPPSGGAGSNAGKSREIFCKNCAFFHFLEGQCRRNAPPLPNPWEFIVLAHLQVFSLAAIKIAKLDPDDFDNDVLVETTEVYRPDKWPQVGERDWCGHFEEAETP